MLMTWKPSGPCTFPVLLVPLQPSPLTLKVKLDPVAVKTGPPCPFRQVSGVMLLNSTCSLTTKVLAAVIVIVVPESDVPVMESVSHMGAHPELTRGVQVEARLSR